jgi:soluble lytic murein transglycosylase
MKAWMATLGLLGMGSMVWAAEEPSFTAVLKSGQTGLKVRLEDHEGPWPPQLIRSQARDYIAYRRDRMQPQKRLLFLADCLAKPAENLFCETVAERERRAAQQKNGKGASASPNPVPGPVAETPAPEPSQVAAWMAQDSLEPLAQVSESLYHRALRSFTGWAGLEKLVSEVESNSSCTGGSALRVALAQKAEEYFPDPKARQDAEKLYEKSAACALNPDDSAASKARFRLALLKIWDGEYRKADSLLQPMSVRSENEFASRSLFWRAWCAKQTGNKLAFRTLKARLAREYPLSFHNLILADRKERRGDRWLAAAEPRVSFRSMARPEVNPWLLGAEILQAEGAEDLSVEILESAIPKFETAESPVRLYAALLMWRAGGRLPSFRLLSGVFRDDPSALGRATLEVFYPLERFELIRQHEAKADPYLLAALIRQESGFNVHARSPVGAVGLMQLMPDTARRFERVSPRRLYDPKVNVRVGARYFRELLDRYGGDAELSLAAYNAGPEKVDEWRRRYPVALRPLFLDLIPYQETRNYVALIGRNWFWYTRLYGPGAPQPQKQVAGAKAKTRGRFVVASNAAASHAQFPSLKLQ